MKSLILSSFMILALMACSQAREFPPKITDPAVSRTQYEKAQNRIVLSCKAESSPAPTYQWRKDGTVLTVGGGDIQVDPDSGELLIEEFTRREEGQYQCFVSNVISTRIITAISPIITLEMISLGSWENTGVDPAVVTVSEGEPLTMPCDNPPESNPPGQFKWYEGDDKGREIKQTDRIAIDQEGTLHFAYIVTTDELGGKEYKCALYNRLLGSINLGGSKRILVTSTGSIPQRKPSATFSKTNVKATLGTFVDLECIFSGNPVPAITWKNQENKEVVASEKYEFGETSEKRLLRVKMLEESDEGTYTCKGSNNNGAETKYTTLNVTSPPIWVNGLKSSKVAVGKSAQLTCEARSARLENDPDRPIWYENGDPIPQEKFDSGKYVLNDNGQVLTVTNLVKPDDVTCFQCKVTNSEGFIFGDGCLDVIEPIVITSQPPAIQRIVKDDIVNLTVTATSASEWPLQYKWYFNDQTVDLPRFVVFDKLTNEAHINTESLTEEEYKAVNGTYVREVYHQFDRVNITMQVILKEVAVTGPATASAGMDLWWIALLISIIVLICVIVIICVVCRRKAQEGVYPLDKKERANDLDPEKELADSGFHDLSRADDNGLEKKGVPLNFTDEPFHNEDEDSLAEYGEDVGKFNEDGSFIGIYMNQKTAPAKQNGGETQI